MHVTVPATAHARTQRLLAPCKHTLLLLERPNVVQPHGVPIVSGGTRAADTSDDDPLSANTLRALPPNDTMSQAACTSTSAATTTRRAYQQGVSADHVGTSPRMNKTCSTHSTTVNIPFRTTCRDIWETTQTWPLPTNVCISHLRRPSSAVNSAQFSPTTGVLSEMISLQPHEAGALCLTPCQP